MSYETRFYRFDGYPVSDSCWSLSAGPDGRIYAAACCECSPGKSVKVVRYNEETDALDYLFDVAEVMNDPPDSGRATQCKIHYSFAASPKDGIMYCASHLSGPPVGFKMYSPWRYWHDVKHGFRGAALIAYDTKTDRISWTDTFIPKEGCRCLALDSERDMLYAISYPRDHLIEYSIKERRTRDLGRLGSVNSQAIFVDRKHMVWTSNDDGRLVRFDPFRDVIEESPYILPHPEFQTGWHSVFYDVASRDIENFYIVTWNTAPRLYRFRPEDGAFGRIEDLGPATQERNTAIPYSMFVDHAGGLVFDRDGMLYYVKSRWKDEREQTDMLASDASFAGKARRSPKSSATLAPERQFEAEGVVVRIDPATLAHEEVAILKRPDAIAQYCPRAAMDKNGDLFFGNVGKIPVGFFKMTMPNRRPASSSGPALRTWG